jgi:hypothetical protein
MSSSRSTPRRARADGGVIEADDLAAGRVSEDEVERSAFSDDLSTVATDEVHPGRPGRGSRGGKHRFVGVDGEDGRVDSGAETVDDPTQADAGTGAEFQDPRVLW